MIILIVIIFKVNKAIITVEYVLTPPELPKYQKLDTKYINQTGWGKHDKEWFYHVSQGTATLPVPYQWLIALEEPAAGPWWALLPFGSSPRYMDEYILRLGFIQSETPGKMPIGIAKTESIYFAGLDRKATAAGFNCSACHTGQLVHDKIRYVIDGGPAMIDLGLLTSSLGASLGQTALSSKLIWPLNRRFDHFAKNVLGSNYNVITKERLKTDLTSTLKELSKHSDVVNVTEGFT
ncbi:MAG: hypothetical protein D3925_02790, partial [Candidatus Electrothrix sp. AR5]|nr:hypothetical protein [Candidatus Electrothrix sp. AR5]